MFSLWRKARRENSAASRLLGTTSLRFALHGWQRRYWGSVSISCPACVAIIPCMISRVRKNRGSVVDVGSMAAA
ncbi:hypothetical protein, partial [Thiolapillus sp.]|uniref:hypothetical protein n=1 Tax=Thiolapillus sp. TaxID=2017437 RepID=UPI0025CB8413